MEIGLEVGLETVLEIGLEIGLGAFWKRTLDTTAKKARPILHDYSEACRTTFEGVMLNSANRIKKR